MRGRGSGWQGRGVEAGLSVPTFLQTVRAVAGFLDRAAKHCAETGVDPDDFVNARLFDAPWRVRRARSR
ncbi:DUF1993 family protein [Hyalangium versicolor]|uniref:DUF1993 family protein n=1 Tax=Hyalangium versicolor TaxID=2861190 RepID=UPI0035A104F8